MYLPWSDGALMVGTSEVQFLPGSCVAHDHRLRRDVAVVGVLPGDVLAHQHLPTENLLNKVSKWGAGGFQIINPWLLHVFLIKPFLENSFLFVC